MSYCLHAEMIGTSLLIILVPVVQGVPVCEWGKYGDNCDRLCSDQCRLHPGRNLPPCQKDTGKCSEGCVRGRHGDHCDQLCSPNCIKTTCNQPNGECTIGCMEGYSGYFCNITTGVQIQTTVPTVQDVPVCEWGKYGHNCDRLCSDQCRLHPVRNLRHCQKYTGKCSEGCVRGRHGDHCDQLCSPNCINNSCIQLNGGCTIGCIDGYSGYFCNITAGVQIQSTVTTTYRPCGWGRFGETCDQACPPGCALGSDRNTSYCQTDTGTCTRGCRRGWHGDRCEKLCGGNCIVDICHQGSGHCTHGCRGRYTGEFCEAETVEGHITQSMQWMWMIPVLIILTMCCWKSPRCRRTFDKACTRLTGSARCRRTLVEWFTRLMRRNPSASSSDPSLKPLVKGQDSDRRASGDLSWDPSHSEEDSQLSTASHATPSQADYDLFYASRFGDLDEVKRLLTTPGVDVNCRVEWRSLTPVMEAAWWGHRDVVELLVSKGADVSLVDGEGDNTLHWACMRGDVEMVKYVLSLNVVDIDARDNSGKTALDRARDWERPRLMELLKPRGDQ